MSFRTTENSSRLNSNLLWTFSLLSRSGKSSELLSQFMSIACLIPESMNSSTNCSKTVIQVQSTRGDYISSVDTWKSPSAEKNICNDDSVKD